MTIETEIQELEKKFNSLPPEQTQDALKRFKRAWIVGQLRRIHREWDREKGQEIYDKITGFKRV